MDGVINLAIEVDQWLQNHQHHTYVSSPLLAASIWGFLPIYIHPPPPSPSQQAMSMGLRPESMQRGNSALTQGEWRRHQWADLCLHFSGKGHYSASWLVRRAGSPVERELRVSRILLSPEPQQSLLWVSLLQPRGSHKLVVLVYSGAYGIGPMPTSLAVRQPANPSLSRSVPVWALDGHRLSPVLAPTWSGPGSMSWTSSACPCLSGSPGSDTTTPTLTGRPES